MTSEEMTWKHEFDSKIDFAAENSLKNWFSFDYSSVIEYTHWLGYPKKEIRRIPFNIKLFVLNLRLVFNPSIENIKYSPLISQFIKKHKAYRNEMGPLIGPSYKKFIGNSVNEFIDSFSPKKVALPNGCLNLSVIIAGEPKRKDVPIIILFDKQVSFDGKWTETIGPKLLDRIKLNIGELKSRFVHKWDEAFEYKKFYYSESFYSHPDYRYCDFIVVTSLLNADTLKLICNSLIGRNCQRLEKKNFTLPYLWQHDAEHLRPSCSMIDGCNHIPNFAILALDYDITPEEFKAIMDVNPTQESKLGFQIQRQDEILQQQRILKAEVARKRAEEQEAKRRLEEKRRYNIRNQHHKDSRIVFDSCSGGYSVDGETLDNIKYVINTLFPEFDKAKYIEMQQQETHQDYNTILSQLKEKSKKTQTQEQSLHSSVDYWFRTGYPNEDICFKLFKEFADSKAIFPYRTNWHIYDTNARLAGTIDLTTQNSDGSLIIYLLTTRSYIIRNGMPIKINENGVTAKSPISNVSDTLYSRIALELNILKYILETYYGQTISEMRLGVFNDSNSKPYILRIPEMKSEAGKIIETRNDLIF